MKTINGVMLSKMITNASKLLDLHREKIDALNVFPVPDGDTGTNMSLTVKSAVKELKNVKSNTILEVCDATTKGALRGARGNSGVITSQVFRGICSVLSKAQEIDIKVFVKSMKSATEIAYSAVSKPKEGTMLSVCKAMSEAAVSSKARSFEDLFADIIKAGDVALAYTPEQLPVLKKAGVVDSGGMGLLTIFKGMQKALLGEEIEAAEEDLEPVKEEKEHDHADIFSLGAIEFGYCTEFFIINIKKKTTLAAIDRLREYLMTIGDSVIVVGDLEFVKVHVHTNNPGRALSHALELGEVDKVKIENMLEQNRELVKKYEAERKEMGMLAICSGKGFEEMFKDIGVDGVVEGGQTMNPSASDIADAIMRINAKNVFVFPNNKNITLAAEQSKQLVENRNVHVIPTKNIPQGILAALEFNPEESPSVNKINMLHAIDNVVAGQVTYAVRNSKTDGFTLKTGDIIGLNDKKILAKANKIGDCVKELVSKLATDSHCVVNLYYGEDVKEEDAEAVADLLREAFPSLDVELFYGGQAVYYYIISLE
ncbi:MAG: DAK2 domain-containing protein [Clostridia bacterium]|nr:DAK2 domain-containing protein [Clostridia bacterium]